MMRVDPSLNTKHEEARARLPWPWPPPATLQPGVLEPNRSPFVVPMTFQWVSASGSIVEELSGKSRTMVSGLHDWKVSLGTDRRLLQLEFSPKEGARSL